MSAMGGARTNLLQTRVARRIFLLFFLCALMPIGALATLSYYHVARQLRDQGQQRLQQATKSVGMGMVERLSLVEAELKVLGATFAATPAGTPYATATSGFDLGVRFGAVALAREGEGLVPLYGDMESPAQVSPEEAEHLSSGRAALRTMAAPSGSYLMMGWSVDRQDLSQGIVWGAIDPNYLWFAGQDADVLPPANKLCVFDHVMLPMTCTRPFPEKEFERLAPQLAVGVADAFEWRDDQVDFLAAYRAFPIGFSYLMPRFTVILSEPSTNVLAPMLSFRQTFPAAVLLVLFGSLATQQCTDPKESRSAT